MFSRIFWVVDMRRRKKARMRAIEPTMPTKI